ncbi:MAG TPA: hypothetical protein VNK96_00655 [Fimbriimonadales bacterium]|nr:hypothetical protein [Fimbriimonadales bacterium]
MNNQLKVIASFGEKYQKEYLYNKIGKQDLQKLLKENWYEALIFFFNKSFKRGRKNEISLRFLHKTIKVLDEYFKNSARMPILKENWKFTLQNKLQKGEVTNRYDRGMVLSTLELIQNLDDNNIINYSLQLIENNQIEIIYNQLDSLIAVGDKIASYFLRDVACIFDSNIHNDKQVLLQPIDTRVSYILEELHIAQKNEINKAKKGNKNSLKHVREAIIKRCNESRVSPIEFNQGAWYLGFHNLFHHLERSNAGISVSAE